MSPLRALDNFLYAGVSRRWTDDRVADLTRKLSTDGSHPLLPEAAQRTFESIDTKAASLLTHVSMMVAALGITATVIAETKIEQAFMIGQIMLYLLIAIACLRCSSLFRGLDETLPPEELSRELILRREIYGFCNAASIYLTVIVLLMLPILFYI